MTTDTLIALLTNPITAATVVATLVALVRRYAPAVDGVWTLLVAFMLSEGACISAACYSATAVTWRVIVGGAFAGVVACVVATGGTEWLSRLAGKVGGSG